MYLISSAAAMLIGFLLELTVGWPEKIKHPIVLIGGLINAFEKSLRSVFPKTPGGERTAGIIMAVFVPLISLVVSRLVLAAAYWIHLIAGFVVETVMCWSIFASGSLKHAGMEVYHALDRSLDDGRKAVSMIVGRETQNLSRDGVIKAAVETVAENTSDGVVAPVVFTCIGGAAFGYFYKSVNTMDSMCGYKNDKYMYYGTGGARLDDFCSYLPARISGLLMVLFSGFLGFDRKNAWKIFKRDRFNHASPNSAQTESVMAGALNIQLAGDAVYFGKLYKKKTIGDKNREIEKEDIVRSCRLMTATSCAAIIIFSLLRFAVGLILVL